MKSLGGSYSDSYAKFGERYNGQTRFSGGFPFPPTWANLSEEVATMFWVIRNSNGFWVARPGSRCSFTGRIQNAQRFATQEAAQMQCCGNEHPEQFN